MDQDTTGAWLALLSVAGLGPKRLNRLLEVFGSAAAVLAAPIDALRTAGLASALSERVHEADPDSRQVRRLIDQMQALAVELLPITAPQYPALLRESPDPPAVLFVRGNRTLLERPQIALVGSRRATRAGAQFAADLAAGLADVGLVVTSGMALGIDAAAHQGALAAGGSSIAVVGTGLDRCYPASHHDLQTALVDQGALVSEFSFGTPPRPAHFPRRNRIIAGLSLGVVVVEAGLHSGSLSTAKHALEANREVYAVPGSVHSPLSKGCHLLLRQGAKLTESVADVVEELGWGATGSPVSQHSDDRGPPGLTSGEFRVLGALGFTPTPVDELVSACGMDVALLMALLTEWELRGWVAPEGPGYVRTPNAPSEG